MWMGFCGIWFQFILSFVQAVKGGNWRTTYKNGLDECKTYIQPFI
jgi:hypothetical protein